MNIEKMIEKRSTTESQWIKRFGNKIATEYKLTNFTRKVKNYAPIILRFRFKCVHDIGIQKITIVIDSKAVKCIFFTLIKSSLILKFILK